MGRRFWLLLSAYLVSSLGNWVYRLTLPLFVLHLTGSALQTGAVYAVTFGPHLLLLLPGGLLADRLPRQRLLVTGDLAAGALAAVLAVEAGLAPLWVIYLLAFLLACVDPLYHPAFQAIVPELVDEVSLPVANARLYGGDSVLNLLGPVLGGTLVVTIGYGPALYLDAATFFVSALLLTLVGPTRRPSGGRRAGLAEGARFLRASPFLWTAAWAFAAFNLCICTVQFNVVYYLSHYEGFGPVLVGAVLGLEGLGLLLGATAAPALLARYGPGTLITGGNAVMGAGVLLLPLLHGPVAIGTVWAVVFAGGGLADVAMFTTRHRLVPSRLLGRVIGASRMIAWAAMPVAALLGGVLEEPLGGFERVILLAGFGNLVTALLAMRSALVDPLPAQVSLVKECP
ncbi:MFS transporter [Actinocorallia longicatena]|uniref:MFS transporter n=1 Tax=Actinocorallia longicatena TaxID=111803 RepID=A0ABP6QGK2_9ACTN